MTTSWRRRPDQNYEELDPLLSSWWEAKRTGLQWWWEANRTRLLWAGIIIATLAFLIIVICGYLFGWKWSGLPKRTLWDWIKLLIVPAVIAGGTLV
jgi:hypothetical protein